MAYLFQTFDTVTIDCKSKQTEINLTCMGHADPVNLQEAHLIVKVFVNL